MNGAPPVLRRSAAPDGAARWRDLGDRLWCAVVVLVAVAAFVWLGWYVWQMPSISNMEH